ncbi:MAG: replicative DNA helicase, partial [Bacteroidota bacterium]
QAVDVEQAVLGAMLIAPEAIPQAIEVLSDEAFYQPKHQKVYRAMLSLFERGNPVDLITLTDELKRRGELDDVGGAYYLTELTARVASAANVEHHARIIAEKSLVRQMIEVMTRLVGVAYDPGTDAFDLLDEAERDIFRISESQLRKSSRSMSDVVKETIERLQSIHGMEGGITGVPSGFTRLDDMTSGWQPSDMVIIAARPSMGKTAFSLAVTRNAALHPTKPCSVAYFSLEMSAGQLAQRLLTSEARIDAQKARTGRLSDEDWPNLARAAGRLAEAKIFIDDTPGLGVLELRAKCRRLKAEHDIGLVIVDYLQLMHGPKGSSKSSNREQEIAAISRSMKSLAKELDVPVIALSQLSRAVETRGGDKRPMLSDLRESGCLTGDTLVTLAGSGRRVPIRELAARHENGGFDVWALDCTTYRIGASQASRAFSTGVKPVFKLTTASGRTIRATANHKFLSFDGWKRLDELTTSDRLALPRTIASTKDKATLSLDELALLGHLIGDGCTLPRHAVQYTTREPDLANHVAELARNIFGDDIAPRISNESPSTRQTSWFQVYLTSTRQHTHGTRNAIAEWLDTFGAWGLRSYEKRVPGRVFEQPVGHIAHFLRHLWATDGCIRLVAGRSPRAAIYYATSSVRLGHDVQALLLRLGINARIKRVRQPGKGRDQYHVIVSGKPEVLAFASRVGAVGQYKQESLAAVENMVRARPGNTNRDVIPRSAWETLVRPARKTVGLSERAFQAAIGTAYCGSSLYRSAMSRTRAGHVADVVESEPLRHLAQSDVYWDPVASIEPDGVEEVFDLTVPGPHNFEANGLIVHNSIEQDADVVMFIYRAERYGITVDENGNSTEGLAEIIIGKQRNGPIGNVNLAFVNQYARFENLTQYYTPPGGDAGFGPDDAAGFGPPTDNYAPPPGDGFDSPPGGGPSRPQLPPDVPF